jgi:arylsulfatase A-like enzyme
VRKDAKYLFWPDFNFEELFDLKADPAETHNLVADPAYAATLAVMRERFAVLKTAAR